MYCTECQRAYVREHYSRRTQYYLEKAVRSNKKRTSRCREQLVEMKSVPCADCGATFPACAMDFDHVRGVKRMNVGAARAYGVPALLIEAAKCEIVCANCHRVRTLRRLMERP